MAVYQKQSSTSDKSKFRNANTTPRMRVEATLWILIMNFGTSKWSEQFETQEQLSNLGLESHMNGKSANQST